MEVNLGWLARRRRTCGRAAPALGIGLRLCDESIDLAFKLCDLVTTVDTGLDVAFVGCEFRVTVGGLGLQFVVLEV